MANLETEVYELLKLFETSDIIKHDEEISRVTALQLHKLVQAHDSANFLAFLTASLQDSQSHGFLGNIILKCFFLKIKTEM